MNNTFYTIGHIKDKNVVKALQLLIEKIDELFANRGSSSFSSSDYNALKNKVNSNESKISDNRQDINTNTQNINTNTQNINTNTQDINDLQTNTVKIQNSPKIKEALEYETSVTSFNDYNLVSKKYVGDNFTNNPSQSDPGDLTQSISDPPTQTEVQNIQDKVNEILQVLRDSNITN